MRHTGSSVSWRSVVRFPGILGTIAFGLYVAWNGHWLAQGRIPPSILLGLTGLPAPTTGMSRSTLAFLHGNVWSAFMWNPFTLPFCVVLTFTAVEIGWKWMRQRRCVLSRPLVLAWCGVLVGGWITKLLMGPQWW